MMRWALGIALVLMPSLARAQAREGARERAQERAQDGARATAVYTDTSDVHACVSHGGATVAATGGGVVVTKDGVSRVLTARDGLPDTRAYAVLERPEGLWVGTDRGAVLLGAAFEPRRTALDVSVRGLAFWKGDVVAASFGAGLVDLTRGTSIAAPDARVLSLSTEGGTLDIGTMSGIYRQTGATFVRASSAPEFAAPVQCQVPSNGLPSNDVNAVAADARTLWVGTFDRGLARLDGDRFIPIDGVDRRIDALALDRRTGRVWVGTARGLYVVDGDGSRLVLGGEEIHALTALEGGGVLGGTSHGAFIMRARDGVITRIGKKEGVDIPSVTAVLAHGNTLFLGTTGGLFIGSANRFTRLSVASGHLPDDWVTALAARGDVVFAGTYNAGVARLEKTESGWRAERLGGGFVNPAGLTVDGDTLYVSTMDGLLTSTQGAPLARGEAVPLGRDVTGVAVSAFGTFVSSRRGILKL
jgi:ligand-binding sensor domain-containing protein